MSDVTHQHLVFVAFGYAGATCGDGIVQKDILFGPEKDYKWVVDGLKVVELGKSFEKVEEQIPGITKHQFKCYRDHARALYADGKFSKYGIPRIPRGSVGEDEFGQKYIKGSKFQKIWM